MAEVEAAEVRKRKRKSKSSKRQHGGKKRVPKWKVETEEIELVTAGYEVLGESEIAKFTDLPLSKNTHEGLKRNGYTSPTKIQKEAIPLALQGQDVLGAAKTGSGKTLAFLVPVLELLWRERWTSDDGLGALIISPTRELAYQTFEVLRKVGCCHDLSAGLVIGGKDVEGEKNRIQHMNILVCTPGRLLHHMDQTVNFDCSNLKILILDEADRILDLGFQTTMNAIVENLPPERQTLLFSATQTKSVRDLARLSLSDPEYVAVHEHSKSCTPHKLSQSYITCKLPDKLSVLYSFIRSHLTCKTIVFLSSCKQVKFTFEAFRRLRPGVPLMALYGKQKQIKRMAIYNDFCAKKSAVLLCTDIAARGLDIPAVDWVVQLDCPEDANTYIHRVGRTARYKKDGNALLVLIPSEEEGILETLREKKIPIDEIRVNPKKMVSIQSKLETFCAQNQDMKHWAQRSFICYLRSVHLQSNKSIFDVHKLPTDEYAKSLGLSQPPRIRFLQREAARKLKDTRGQSSVKDTQSVMEEGQSDEEGVAPLDRFDDNDDTDSEDEDILQVKRVIPPSKVSLDPKNKKEAATLKATSKASAAKKLIHKKIKTNTHIKFDEEGDQVESPSDHEEEEVSDSDTPAPDSLVPVPLDDFEQSKSVSVGGIDVSSAQELLRVRDKQDRKRERERIKATHRERRLKKNRLTYTENEEDSALGVTLAGSEEESEDQEEMEDVQTLEEEGRPSEDSSNSDSDENDVSPPRAKKRKKVDQRSKRIHKQLGTDSAPDLNDDEELALHLLAS